MFTRPQGIDNLVTPLVNNRATSMPIITPKKGVETITNDDYNFVSHHFSEFHKLLLK